MNQRYTTDETTCTSNPLKYTHFESIWNNTQGSHFDKMLAMLNDYSGFLSWGTYVNEVRELMQIYHSKDGYINTIENKSALVFTNVFLLFQFSDKISFRAINRDGSVAAIFHILFTNTGINPYHFDRETTLYSIYNKYKHNIKENVTQTDSWKNIVRELIELSCNIEHSCKNDILFLTREFYKAKLIDYHDKSDLLINGFKKISEKENVTQTNYWKNIVRELIELSCNIESSCKNDIIFLTREFYKAKLIDYRDKCDLLINGFKKISEDFFYMYEIIDELRDELFDKESVQFKIDTRITEIKYNLLKNHLVISQKAFDDSIRRTSIQEVVVIMAKLTSYYAPWEWQECKDLIKLMIDENPDCVRCKDGKGRDILWYLSKLKDKCLAIEKRDKRDNYMENMIGDIDAIIKMTYFKKSLFTFFVGKFDSNTNCNIPMLPKDVLHIITSNTMR